MAGKQIDKPVHTNYSEFYLPTKEVQVETREIYEILEQIKEFDTSIKGLEFWEEVRRLPNKTYSISLMNSFIRIKIDHGGKKHTPYIVGMNHEYKIFTIHRVSPRCVANFRIVDEEKAIWLYGHIRERLIQDDIAKREEEDSKLIKYTR